MSIVPDPGVPPSSAITASYDADLIVTMRAMADRIEPVLGPVAVTLRQGADRIEALSTVAVPARSA